MDEDGEEIRVDIGAEEDEDEEDEDDDDENEEEEDGRETPAATAEASTGGARTVRGRSMLLLLLGNTMEHC